MPLSEKLICRLPLLLPSPKVCGEILCLTPRVCWYFDMGTHLPIISFHLRQQSCIQTRPLPSLFLQRKVAISVCLDRQENVENDSAS